MSLTFETAATATQSHPSKAEPMTATLTPNPATSHPVAPDHGATKTPTASSADTTARLTFPRVINSEWLKFRTVRSNVIAVAGAAVAAIGFGALFSSLAGSGDGPGRFAQNALSLSLGGFQLSQIIIAILGVSLVAGEYQTGLMRTWFGAAPDRFRVLGAKISVYGVVAFLSSLVAAVAAFLIGQALLPASFAALTLGSDGVMQALLGTAFYTACIAVMGIGLGFLLRSTAAGAGAVVTALMIAPLMVSLLPASMSDPIGKILPSSAGNSVQGLQTTGELLSTGWGIAVLLAWVIGIVGAAAVSLKRRDA